ncbi:serine protease inhibitor [Pseudarthrobacter sp. J1738]|uniref:serine protease inhibitor n=1 Tax=unclassified Pseudarthrobacter TaxID=2647000 RepID=UPI003D28C85A
MPHESPSIDLTVTLVEAPGAPEYVFRLLTTADGAPAPECTVSDPPAALNAVVRFGDEIFFPQPGPPKLCTQQYGGPAVATVTGSFNGRDVNSTFTRTDGCEIARWKALAPLLQSGGNS